jgi:hypothetical protein
LVFADKLELRNYVTATVGEEFLTRLYDVVRSDDDVASIQIPSRCVVKAAHGSGAIFVVDDRIEEQQGIPHADERSSWNTLSMRIHPQQVATREFQSFIRAWTRTHYRWDEWAYSATEPRVMVEELLDDGTGPVSADYKFWCFDGVVAFVHVLSGRFQKPRQTVHRRDWTLIDGRVGYWDLGSAPPRPPRWNDMVEVAERLSAPIDFVRVDLYAPGDRIVVGELTNYPDAGRGDMVPEELFTELGSVWTPAALRAQNLMHRTGRRRVI